ncbi:MAG: dinitrogenase iron-molybdenum cofactor biosynthesis protein [Clostridia bacterium]|nr:dinitrogenase iron-molybdenum cofactor biosynthesis protein [Clostridia bacterium]
MKLVVTYENGQIFQHFGHTEQFKIYDIEDGSVVSAQVVHTMGQGHGMLAGFLAGRGVKVLICGGIGGGAQAALAEAGIQLYGGVSGDADEAVTAFLAGTLAYQPDVMCNHHGGGVHHCHTEGHTCGGKCHE